MLLKRELGPKPWPLEAVVGVNSAKNHLGFGFKLASKRPRFPPRSGHDRDPESPSIIVSSSRSDFAAKDLRSRLDRTAIVGFFHALSASSDALFR